MPEWFALTTLVPTALLAVLWMRDRRRFAGKIRELSSQQSETTRVLNDLIEESGRITEEFARLITQPAPAFSGQFRDKGTPEPRRKGVEKRHLVLHLAQKGHSAKEIAEHLMMPGGEVDLILSLNQSRRAQVSA